MENEDILSKILRIVEDTSKELKEVKGELKEVKGELIDFKEEAKDFKEEAKEEFTSLQENINFEVSIIDESMRILRDEMVTHLRSLEERIISLENQQPQPPSGVNGNELII